MPSQPLRTSVTGLSSSSGFPTYYCDTYIRPFSVAVAVVASSSGTTYSVQHTYDYTGSSAFISTAATWFTPSAFSSIAGTNVDGSYGAPVSAIRLNVTAGSSTVVTNFTVIQAG